MVYPLAGELQDDHYLRTRVPELQSFLQVLEESPVVLGSTEQLDLLIPT